MKVKLLTSSILLILVLLYSCKKDFPRQAAVLTESMDKPTAIAYGKVIDLGQNTITDHGFCWDSSGFPSVEGKKIQLGIMGQTGDFSGKIPGLSPNKVYYLKAWVSSEKGVVYGDLLSFTTPDLPVLILQQPGEITDTSAKCIVDVSSDGGSPITARGLCWNTQQNPDTNNSVFHDSIHAIGLFSYTISGLSHERIYYVRAFAKNIYGIRYSDEVSFTTTQSTSIPKVSTAELINIGISTVTTGGNVSSDGGFNVTVRGVCWGTTPDPTIDQSKTNDGNGTGDFISSVTGLIANTTYYLRAYATNEEGTAYGAEKTFATLPNPGIPSVITASITNITSNTATSGGTVLESGGATVSERGVCWSTAPSPNTNNEHTSDGSGVGSFISSIHDLEPGTKYYVRAYATNSVGIGYGNEINFTAGQNITAPTVTTAIVTDVTTNTAKCGGNVTSDGGATVSVRGVCWSLTENPTISNSHTTEGGGTGVFSSSMTGLAENTSYHVRAYATNNAGTSYGSEVIFSTLPVYICGQQVVYEGRTYNTIQIGTQCWFKENLNVGNRIDGSQSQKNNGTKEKYCYDNNSINCSYYGGLYQWDEAMQYSTTQGTQGLCPSGWHIPKNSEWNTLTTFLGGTSVSGGKMKETGYAHWNSPNTGATNESAFTALGSGYRNCNNGLFYEKLTNAFFWSSSQSQADASWGRNLIYNTSSISISNSFKTNGLSIRCLKD